MKNFTDFWNSYSVNHKWSLLIDAPNDVMKEPLARRTMELKAESERFEQIIREVEEYIQKLE